MQDVYGKPFALINGKNIFLLRTDILHLWRLNELETPPALSVFNDALIYMPLYEYELCEGDCVVCGGKFTLRRPLRPRN